MSRRAWRVKNVLGVCAAPLEVLVSALYWGIRGVSGFFLGGGWAGEGRGKVGGRGGGRGDEMELVGWGREGSRG